MRNSDSNLWQSVHAESYVFESLCWKTCSGFCCANGHKDFNFRLMPMHQGTTILYMGPEYRWMREHRKVLFNSKGLEAAEPRFFDFGGPAPLSIYHATCKLLGQCEGKLDKPFLCKIYPFLPILDFSGQLEELYPSSIFELTFALKQEATPCTVSSKKEIYFKKWAERPETLAPLVHPTMIFYLRAAKHFMDSYAIGFSENLKIQGLTGKVFWQTWELEYLSGKFIDADQLKRKILDDYWKIKQLHGEFEI